MPLARAPAETVVARLVRASRSTPSIAPPRRHRGDGPRPLPAVCTARSKPSDAPATKPPLTALRLGSSSGASLSAQSRSASVGDVSFVGSKSSQSAPCAASEPSGWNSSLVSTSDLTPGTEARNSPVLGAAAATSSTARRNASECGATALSGAVNAAHIARKAPVLVRTPPGSALPGALAA